MNEIQENFNKQFEKETIWDKIESRKWQIVSLLLMISLLLMSLGIRDFANNYAETYAEWYCYNKLYNPNFRFNKTLNVSR